METKNNIRQADKFTTCRLNKFLERDHHEAEIFPATTTKNYQNRSILRKNTGVKTVKKYIQTNSYNLLLWKTGQREVDAAFTIYHQLKNYWRLDIYIMSQYP